MDLAEFEHRSLEDKMQLPPLLSTISRQCQTVLSLNLKEAWQLGDLFGGSYQGLKLPHEVMKLADFIRGQLEVDRVLIHPNDGAVCASSNGTSYVLGPFCQNPLISTGAGDHFGAGALAGVLSGLDDLGILLAGVISSGYYVRSGKAPTIDQSVSFLDLWEKGDLPERLIETSSDLSVAQH